MSLKLENIKKLMGWCPNAKAYETRRNVNLENFDSDIPDRERGKNGDLRDPGWFQKESNQMLLFGILLTFVYLLIYSHIGFIPLTLLGGFFTGLAAIAGQWNHRIQRYDATVKKPVVRHVSLKKSFLISLAIIIFVLFPLAFFLYILNVGVYPIQFLFSLLANVPGVLWGAYFQLVYWEKKNHIRICKIYENGFQKTYAVGEKEGEL